MLKYALLASGSKGNCCLIRDAQTNIIIDCGTTQKYLKNCFDRLQYDYLKSDALLITHAHRDHIAQLKMFDSIPTYSKTKLETNAFTQIEDYSQIDIHTLRVEEIPLSHDSEACSGFVVYSGTQKLVYLTDTGYLKEEHLTILENADYYIVESNHDVEMLMQTSRPMFTKQRIISDVGHLCNEDCAYLLSRIIGSKTKEIVLAHISEQGNTMEKAKEVLLDTLRAMGVAYAHIRIVSAPQFEIIRGGEQI